MCKFFWHLSLSYLSWVTALVLFSNVITNFLAFSNALLWQSFFSCSEIFSDLLTFWKAFFIEFLFGAFVAKSSNKIHTLQCPPWSSLLEAYHHLLLIHDSWYDNVFVSPLLTTFFLNKDSWSAIMFYQISVLLNATSYLDLTRFSGHWLCQLIYMNHLPQQNVHHEKFQKSQQELQFRYIFLYAHHLNLSFHIQEQQHLRFPRNATYKW